MFFVREANCTGLSAIVRKAQSGEGKRRKCLLHWVKNFVRIQVRDTPGLGGCQTMVAVDDVKALPRTSDDDGRELFAGSGHAAVKSESVLVHGHVHTL